MGLGARTRIIDALDGIKGIVRVIPETATQRRGFREKEGRECLFFFEVTTPYVAFRVITAAPRGIPQLVPGAVHFGATTRIGSCSVGTPT